MPGSRTRARSGTEVISRIVASAAARCGESQCRFCTEMPPLARPAATGQPDGPAVLRYQVPMPSRQARISSQLSAANGPASVSSQAAEPAGAENLCHQAILVDHISGTVVPPDPELTQVGDAPGRAASGPQSAEHPAR